MIVRSITAKLVSLALATGLVAGGAYLALPTADVRMEGGGLPLMEARMGSRFEDMVAGTLSAVEADRVALAVPVTTPVQQAPAEVLQPQQPVQVTVPSAPPAPAQTVQPAPPSQVIAGQEPDSDAPTLSKRPMRKDPALAEKMTQVQQRERAERERKRAAEKAAAREATRGNAQRDNTRGAQSGTTATAKVQKSGQSAAAATQEGNAAASNYPGQVMRRISRLPRPRVRARGTAVIAFSVSSGGGLARASVVRSSGSAELDRAAISLIRQAAPFPRPPAGAQRQFSIQIKGQ